MNLLKKAAQIFRIWFYLLAAAVAIPLLGLEHDRWPSEEDMKKK